MRDLLNSSGKGKLKVREHKSTGPYVENLTSHAVKDFDMVKQLMDDGNKVCGENAECVLTLVILDEDRPSNQNE